MLMIKWRNIEEILCAVAFPLLFLLAWFLGI